MMQQYQPMYYIPEQAQPQQPDWASMLMGIFGLGIAATMVGMAMEQTPSEYALISEHGVVKSNLDYSDLYAVYFLDSKSWWDFIMPERTVLEIKSHRQWVRVHRLVYINDVRIVPEGFIGFIAVNRDRHMYMTPHGPALTLRGVTDVIEAHPEYRVFGLQRATDEIAATKKSEEELRAYERKREFRRKQL